MYIYMHDLQHAVYIIVIVIDIVKICYLAVLDGNDLDISSLAI